MRKLKNAFSYSIAEEIMPDLSTLYGKTNPDKFALFLKTGESLSIPEIQDIKIRTGLSPLFFEISENSSAELSRSYARGLGAPIVRVITQCKLAFALKECSFTVSEDVTGALLSFLSHTPTYVDAGCAEIRSFIGDISKYDIPADAIIPYTKNRTEIITGPITKYGFFQDAIEKIRADIGADFASLFL